MDQTHKFIRSARQQCKVRADYGRWLTWSQARWEDPTHKANSERRLDDAERTFLKVSHLSVLPTAIQRISTQCSLGYTPCTHPLHQLEQQVNRRQDEALGIAPDRANSAPEYVVLPLAVSTLCKLVHSSCSARAVPASVAAPASAAPSAPANASNTFDFSQFRSHTELPHKCTSSVHACLVYTASFDRVSRGGRAKRPQSVLQRHSGPRGQDCRRL